MVLTEIRGKKANQVRWETLKLLDWEKDSEVIQHIFSIRNPLFFSTRTSEQIINEVKENIRFKKFMDEDFKKSVQE